MEQTVSINLAGMVFHIEKPAYDVLEQYLSDIRQQLSQNNNAEDVLQDVENRMAELFEQRLGNRKEVITHQEVEAVKEEMGAPDSFRDEMDQEQPNQEETKNTASNPKFITRDSENGIIGGVCAGIGHYYDFDPVWLRLGFVAAVLILGGGFLVYIALWLVLPAKKKTIKTTGDRHTAKANSTKNNVLSSIKHFLYQLLAGIEWALQRLTKACRKATDQLQHHS